jgi:hypothetical protein
MIKNKYGQKVFTIEELDAMGLPEEVPYDEENVRKKIKP